MPEPAVGAGGAWRRQATGVMSTARTSRRPTARTMRDRSASDVPACVIQARDGEIGHVDDFLLDDRSWTIRWLVVDTGKWLPGKHVLVAPDWVEDVASTERAVRVGLTRAQIESAPEYDRRLPVDREYEQRLFAHYGRPGYWDRAA